MVRDLLCRCLCGVWGNLGEITNRKTVPWHYLGSGWRNRAEGSLEAISRQVECWYDCVVAAFWLVRSSIVKDAIIDWRHYYHYIFLFLKTLPRVSGSSPVGETAMRKKLQKGHFLSSFSSPVVSQMITALYSIPLKYISGIGFCPRKRMSDWWSHVKSRVAILWKVFILSFLYLLAYFPFLLFHP